MQVQVTTQLGVCRSWLSKIETRERRMDVIELCRLSDVYEISWTEIGSILEERP
jgi:transcriptional regulator with XRE-family HTH domain